MDNKRRRRKMGLEGVGGKKRGRNKRKIEIEEEAWKKKEKKKEKKMAEVEKNAGSRQKWTEMVDKGTGERNRVGRRKKKERRK